MEVWKKLKGIVENGDNYSVSNFGRVKNNNTKNILKLRKTYKGYLQIKLYKNGKSKWYFVHRLVALAFIPNHNNHKEINHKNEIRDSNIVSNLEWCTPKYNCNYGNHIKNISKNYNVKVKAYKLETMEYIGEFETVKKASEYLGVYASGISNVLKKRYKHCKGYYFEYA